MPTIFRRHSLGRPPHPDVLTPAEWRVLDEVREGRSNLEIAERLGVSRNTVKTHIASIRDKLDVRDRDDLAGWRGEPARVQRSPLLAPFTWLASKSEALVMSAVAVAVAVGLVVGIQSGVLTDNPSDLSVLSTATATEVVATPAGVSPIPDCPVIDDVCALAIDLLPAMQTADGQRIAALTEVQQLTCPAFDDYGGGLEALCVEQPSGHVIDVYQASSFKGTYFVTDLGEFASNVSVGLDSIGPPVRVAAVGCLTADDGLRTDCERGAVAVYAGETPPLQPSPTPLPASPMPIPGGKPTESSNSNPQYTALVFSRDAVGQWRVETFMAPFNVPINTAIDGFDGGMFADGAWRDVTLNGYDFR